MKETATISKVDGRLMAEVLRPEACKQCRACEFGREERFFLPIPEDGIEYREGDQVTLSLPDGRVGKASLIAYGMPLVLFLLGLWLGDVIFHDEVLQAVAAVISLCAGFLALRLIDKRFRNEKTFTPTVRPCIQVEGRAECEEE